MCNWYTCGKPVETKVNNRGVMHIAINHKSCWLWKTYQVYTKKKGPALRAGLSSEALHGAGFILGMSHINLTGIQVSPNKGIWGKLAARGSVSGPFEGNDAFVSVPNLSNQ